MNYSRAERKSQIRREVYRHWKRNNFLPITMAQLAKRLGMKVSTNLKNICRELGNEDQQIYFLQDEHGCRLYWLEMEQVLLPPRTITINGIKRTLAAWVGDAREFGGSLS